MAPATRVRDRVDEFEGIEMLARLPSIKTWQVGYSVKRLSSERVSKHALVNIVECAGGVRVQPENREKEDADEGSNSKLDTT